MTPGMWFAWLLRSDVRQGAAPGDKEAQREFVAWWLLWGRREYPEVWHWDAVQAAVAMQLVPRRPRHRVSSPATSSPLSPTRSAACIPVTGKGKRGGILCAGIECYGILELDAAPQLPAACIAMTECPSQRQPWSAGRVQVPRIAITLAHRNSDLVHDGRGDSLGAAQHIAEWFEKHGRRLYQFRHGRPLRL